MFVNYTNTKIVNNIKLEINGKHIQRKIYEHKYQHLKVNRIHISHLKHRIN